MIRRILLAALLSCTVAASAQQTGFKRTILQRTDAGDGREVILFMAEIEPGATSGRHTHPGVEAGYIAEGEATFELAGAPTRTVKAGDNFIVPLGAVHAATAIKATKVIGTLVVEKGKPLATPAP
jgi:quercetin dioxygenase-like cupin family protein